MELFKMNAYISSMLMGSGLTLICLGVWLKYTKNYLLIKVDKYIKWRTNRKNIGQWNTNTVLIVVNRKAFHSDSIATMDAQNMVTLSISEEKGEIKKLQRKENKII